MVVFIEFLIIMVCEVLEKCFRKAAMLRDKVLNRIFFFCKIEQLWGNNTQTLFLKRYSSLAEPLLLWQKINFIFGRNYIFKLPVDTRLIFQKKYLKFIPFWPSFYEVKVLLIRYKIFCVTYTYNRTPNQIRVGNLTLWIFWLRIIKGYLR